MADQLDWDSDLAKYVRDVSLRDDPVLSSLREETTQLPGGRLMQILPEQGQLLATLVHVTNARTVVEIGTFTGYSTLCMARALPAKGRLITCDITDKWAPIAIDHWRRAGVEDRIELRVGDAAGTLTGLIDAEGPDSIDLVFIDADKSSYRTYYELSLRLVRPNGLIVIDNTLFFGRVADPAAQDPDTVAIRELNASLLGDDRVDISLLPMADGITLVRKRDALQQ